MLKSNLGFSLPELMVSVLLGTFIMAISVQVFQGTEKTSSVTQAMNTIVAEATSGMNLFGSSIEQAGYFTDLSVSVVDNFPAATNYQAGQTVSLLKLDSNNNSSIRFRLKGDGDIASYDCVGDIIAQDAEVSMMLMVDATDDDSESLELVCVQEGLAAPLSQVVLARNVESMIIRVGIDTDLDDEIDTWVASNSVAKPAEVSGILAVELDLIFKSEKKVLNEDKSVEFDRIGGTSVTFNDRYIRRQFQGVYSISNQTKG